MSRKGVIVRPASGQRKGPALAGAVRIERAAAALMARPQVGEGARVVLEPGQFSSTTPEGTRRRGEPAAPPFAVSDRNRVDLRFGMWRVTGSSAPSGAVVAGSSTVDLLGSLQYTRFLREAPWARASSPATAERRSSRRASSPETGRIIAVPLGLR